jgi:outer membrane protein insertion porin family
MRNSAPLRRTLLAAGLLFGQLALPLAPPHARAASPGRRQAQAPQQLVESVDITGNRRNRDEDLLYYIQTRPGDPYNEAQVERDFRTLMDLGFFQRTDSRVYTEPGPRGGVNVIFEVRELPIIRDLQFEGLSSVTESDLLRTFRERRVGIQKENISDPVKLQTAVRVIKELLSAKGHPNATVEVRRDEVSATSEAITFVVDENERVRVVEVEFTGNQHFSDGELRGAMRYVKEAGLISRFKGQDILDPQKLEADLKGNVTNYMRSKGYLQARTAEPVIEGLGPRRTGFPVLPLPILSSTDEALRVTVPVIEGKLYRLGDVKIEGNSIFSEGTIRQVIGLNKGDVASGERIYKSLFEELKKYYGNAGFIQYSPDPVPTYKDNPANPQEGIVDYVITIEEGKQFTLRRLEFTGNTFTRDNVLRREFVLNEGDIYNQGYVDFSVLRLNQLGFFDPVDKEKDVDFRQDEESAEVDVTVKVTERGRQQISFNGGISGIGGSFFGLDYSTNNLLGRGESLSLQFAAGNRQSSFVFSFTEPYIRNRPITAGFSVFAYSLKFFGEGTFLSTNPAALGGLFGNQTDFLNVSDENLFTQRTLGGSIYATAPLSEFYKKRPFTLSTRVGLTYSVSQTSVADPPVNQDPNNPSNAIPVIYRQPNIMTSRITPTVVYDSRDMRGVDAINGQQLAMSFAFAGAGGDVRTLQPSVTYQRFFPVRNRRAAIPHVFGFRLLAGHVSSFAISPKVRDAQANSISFINGVPIYERYFLGDEFTLRGYGPRQVSPIVPLELFVTSQGVVVAENQLGAINEAGLIPELQRFASLGTFTPPGGSNPRLVTSGFQPIGADTQLLGNFEYRIPIIGPVSAAAFADIGTVFNLRKGADQVFSTTFQPDEPFLRSTVGVINCAAAPGGLAFATLTTLAACRDDSQLALSLTGGLVARDGRLVTREELEQARRGPLGPDGLPIGFQSVFLRGEAQTNTAVRLSQAAFAKFSDFRSSVGVEFRVQLPVVNVPFRLIYAFNPQARRGLNDRVPLIFNEDRSVFRFSIGRTF